MKEKLKQQMVLPGRQPLAMMFFLVSHPRPTGRKPGASVHLHLIPPPAVTSTDLDPNPARKSKLDDAPQNSEYKKEVHNYTGRILKDTGTGVGQLICILLPK
ncbi:hypothetical protein J3R83DRAFT_5585 [Lanmaoa asiatica]|nr:hypothetical protein J3R83DRAFT_5585 [Lanmaoa asiatica]